MTLQHGCFGRADRRRRSNLSALWRFTANPAEVVAALPRGGVAGLVDRSRRPHRSPSRRVFATEEDLIVSLRKNRRLGIKRLRNELRRLHDIRLSVDTIHKILCRHSLNRLKRPKLLRKSWKRYSRPLPGGRVQMDVCKIGAGLYQYTAIDDCSRYQVVGVFPRKTAASTLTFLEQVVEEMPFSIQRIQADRGQEFFAYRVQERLREWSIKFRPIRPRAPHLNGKVARVQRTALEEFWPTVEPADPEFDDRLAEWQYSTTGTVPTTASAAGPRLTVFVTSFAKLPLAKRSPPTTIPLASSSCHGTTSPGADALKPCRQTTHTVATNIGLPIAAQKLT